MLAALDVRDLLLIDTARLEPGRGLTALTGETGAGKSILLDALGLALGARGERGLVRSGADAASVTAVFEPPPDHPARALLAENGIAAGDELIIRRVIGTDGKSRAFVNDTTVGVGLLRMLGDLLLEVHGQHDERGLLDPSGHRAMLDLFGGHEAETAAAARAHAGWVAAEAALTAHREAAQAAAAQIDWLRSAVQELDALKPEPGEEQQLAAERATLMASEKIAGDLQAASDAMAGDAGLETKLAAALRRLERARPQAGAMLDGALAAMERALVETAEARAQLDQALVALRFDPVRLERIEERLFALRAAARKYRVDPEGLPALRTTLDQRLQAADGAGFEGTALAKAAAAARAAFTAACEALSARRIAAAARLDASVARELKPLKLDRARFQTALEPLAGAEAGAGGAERVTFLVSTNPGTPFGNLSRIASGGELSRFILALKVALARTGSAGTLIFDEIDRGVGGAVADAVGERLAKLARKAQVIVVTHAPQVAARADHHWRIEKRIEKGEARTRITRLADAERREEIARMLSGASVTDEARAQAARLIAGAAG